MSEITEMVEVAPNVFAVDGDVSVGYAQKLDECAAVEVVVSKVEYDDEMQNRLGLAEVLNEVASNINSLASKLDAAVKAITTLVAKATAVEGEPVDEIELETDEVTGDDCF